mgnify:CR=1 FL=1
MSSAALNMFFATNSCEMGAILCPEWHGVMTDLHTSCGMCLKSSKYDTYNIYISIVDKKTGLRKWSERMDRVKRLT